MSNLKTFLESCSDDEINKGVAWCEAKKLSIKHRLLHSWCTLHGYVTWCGRYFKPSSYPNDIIPIAFANNISLMRDWEKSGMYTAIGTRSEMRSLGEYKITIERTIENPLRAICEVYLLMEAQS